ncbi:cation-transporting [Cystoisospora suis]|uniref:Cation-transporting ATPase n=1 Tax=Cystoisospora suis TaxID=483139 RepID=A0A2C6LBI5_9APIC|nr:cation-transporting [Cystoisospora suis]
MPSGSDEEYFMEDRVTPERGREGLYFISYDAFPELQELPLSERIVTAQPYRRLLLHRVILWLLGFLTGGLFFLLSIWFRRRSFFATHAKCDIQNATHLLLTAADGKQHVVRVEKLPFEKAALEAIPPETKKHKRPLVPSGSSQKYESHHGHIDENPGTALSGGGDSKKPTSLRRPIDSAGETIQDKGSQTELVVVEKEGETGEKEDRQHGVNEGVELMSKANRPFHRDREPQIQMTSERDGQKLHGKEGEGQREEMSVETFLVKGGNPSFSSNNVESEEEEEESEETFHDSLMEKNLGKASTSFAWMFEYRCTRYILEDDRENSRALGSSTFRPLAFNVNFPPGRLRKWFLTHPPCPSLVSLRRSLFGRSFIYVPVPSLFTVIMEEVLHPFYIFQILAVALWIWDSYIQYAVAIMVITATSTLVECTQTRRNLKRLRDLAAQKCVVVVQRSSWEKIEDLSFSSSSGDSSSDSCLRVPLNGNVVKDVSPSNACVKEDLPGIVPKKKRRRRRIIRREEVDSADLVVGDLIEISHGMTLPCDAIVIRGTVVVTESCLTGESFPVLKTPLPDTDFLSSALPGDDSKQQKQRPGLNLEQAAKHQLFAGTRVLSVRVSSSLPPVSLQAPKNPEDENSRSVPRPSSSSSSSSSCSSTSVHLSPGVIRSHAVGNEKDRAQVKENDGSGVLAEKAHNRESCRGNTGEICPSPGCSLAAVCRVGYATVQGQTVRRLLYPTKMRIDFEKDALKFVAVLGLLACVGGVFTLVISILHRLSKKEIFLRVFDLFTDAVPPALPASMSVGLSVAVSRLYSLYKVYCTAPSRLGMGGYVRCLCFDKTGTLTEEGVRMAAVLPSCHFCGMLSTTTSTTTCQTKGFPSTASKGSDKRRHMGRMSFNDRMAPQTAGDLPHQGGSEQEVKERASDIVRIRKEETPSALSPCLGDRPSSSLSTCEKEVNQSNGKKQSSGDGSLAARQSSGRETPSSFIRTTTGNIACNSGNSQLSASFLPFMLPNSIRTVAMWTEGGCGGGGGGERGQEEKSSHIDQLEGSLTLFSACSETSCPPPRLQALSSDQFAGELQQGTTSPYEKQQHDGRLNLPQGNQRNPREISICSSQSSSSSSCACDPTSSCCPSSSASQLPFTSFSTAVPSRSPSPSPLPSVRGDRAVLRGCFTASSSPYGSTSSSASCCECVRHVARCMSVCHSLLRIGGELAGDPLELQMVTHTSCLLLDGEGTTEGTNKPEGEDRLRKSSGDRFSQGSRIKHKKQVDPVSEATRGEINDGAIDARNKEGGGAAHDAALGGRDVMTKTRAEDERSKKGDVVELRNDSRAAHYARNEPSKPVREEVKEGRSLSPEMSRHCKTASGQAKEMQGKVQEKGAKERNSGHLLSTESQVLDVETSGTETTGVLAAPPREDGFEKERMEGRTDSPVAVVDDDCDLEEKREEEKDQVHALLGRDELDGVTVGIVEEEQAAFKKLQSELEGGEEIEGLTFVLPPDPFVADRHSMKGALAICRRFEFDSSLQRMSVIVQDTKSREFFVYCKGSTEALRKLCERETLPDDLDEQLHRCSSSGYRVIALAARRLIAAPRDPYGLDWIRNAVSSSPSSEGGGPRCPQGLPGCSPSATSYVRSLSREEAEQGLTFLGLVLFTNELKPESRAVVSSLLDAQCTVRIATGDHPLTSIAVARQCGLLGGVRSSEEPGEQAPERSCTEGEQDTLGQRTMEERTGIVGGEGGDGNVQEWHLHRPGMNTIGKVVSEDWQREGGERAKRARQTEAVMREFAGVRCGTADGGFKVEARGSCQNPHSGCSVVRREHDEGKQSYRSRFSSFFSLFRREKLGARTFRQEYRTRLLSEESPVVSDREETGGEGRPVVWNEDNPRETQRRSSRRNSERLFGEGEGQRKEIPRGRGEGKEQDKARKVDEDARGPEGTRLLTSAEQSEEGTTTEDEMPVVILGDVYTADGEPRIGGAEYLVWTLLPQDSLFSVGERGGVDDVEEEGERQRDTSLSSLAPPRIASAFSRTGNHADGNRGDANGSDTSTNPRSTRQEDFRRKTPDMKNDRDKEGKPCVATTVTTGTFERKKASPSYSSFDLRELLASLADVRQASLVLTGRAFRHLRRLQALTHMPFVEDCDQVIAQVRKQHQELQDRQEDQDKRYRLEQERENEIRHGWRVAEGEDIAGFSSLTESDDDPVTHFHAREFQEDQSESCNGYSREDDFGRREKRSGSPRRHSCESGAKRHIEEEQELSQHSFHSRRKLEGEDSGQTGRGGRGGGHRRNEEEVYVEMSGPRDQMSGLSSPCPPCSSPFLSARSHRPVLVEVEGDMSGSARSYHKPLLEEEQRQRRRGRRRSPSVSRGIAMRKAKAKGRRQGGEDEAEQADAEDFSLDEEDLEAGMGQMINRYRGESEHSEAVYHPPPCSPSFGEPARKLIRPPPSRATSRPSQNSRSMTRKPQRDKEAERSSFATFSRHSQEPKSYGLPPDEPEAEEREEGECPFLSSSTHQQHLATRLSASEENGRSPSSPNKRSSRGEKDISIKKHRRRPHSFRCSRDNRRMGAMDFFLETSEGICGRGGDLDRGMNCTSSSTGESEWWSRNREAESGRGREAAGKHASGAFFSFLKWPLFRRQASVTEAESGMDGIWKRARGEGATRSHRRRGTEGGRTQDSLAEGMGEGSTEFASFLSMKASRGRMKERARSGRSLVKEEKIRESGREEVEEQKLRAVVEALMFPGVAASLLHKQQREEAKGGELYHRTGGEHVVEEDGLKKREKQRGEEAGEATKEHLLRTSNVYHLDSTESIGKKRWSSVTRRAQGHNEERERRGVLGDEHPLDDTHVLASDGGRRRARFPSGYASIEVENGLGPRSAEMLKSRQQRRHKERRHHEEKGGGRSRLCSFSRLCSPLLRPQANSDDIPAGTPSSFPVSLPVASLSRCCSSPPQGRLPSPVVTSQPWTSATLDSESRSSHPTAYLGPEALVCLVQKQLEENKQKHHLFTPGEYLPLAEADQLPLSRVDCLPAFLQHAEQQREEEAACIFQPVGAGEEADLPESLVGPTIHPDEETDAVTAAAASAASALLWGGSTGVPDLFAHLWTSSAGGGGEDRDSHGRKERGEEPGYDETLREEALPTRCKPHDEDYREQSSELQKSAKRSNAWQAFEGQIEEGQLLRDSRRKTERHFSSSAEEGSHGEGSFSQRSRHRISDQQGETESIEHEASRLSSIPHLVHKERTPCLFVQDQESPECPSAPPPQHSLSAHRELSREDQDEEAKETPVDASDHILKSSGRGTQLPTSSQSIFGTSDLCIKELSSGEGLREKDTEQEQTQQRSDGNMATKPGTLSPHTKKEEEEGISAKQDTKNHPQETQGPVFSLLASSNKRIGDDRSSSPTSIGSADVIMDKHIGKLSASLSPPPTSRPSQAVATPGPLSLQHPPRSISPLSVWEGMTLQLRVSHCPYPSHVSQRKKKPSKTDSRGSCFDRITRRLGRRTESEGQDCFTQEDAHCREAKIEVGDRGDVAEREEEEVEDERSSFCFRMSLYEYVVRQTVVLCRASPQDKGEFVAALQQLPCDPFVAMCGDGTNDAVAIKQADIGISILSPGALAREPGASLPARVTPSSSSSPPCTESSWLSASTFSSWRNLGWPAEGSSQTAPLLSDHTNADRHAVSSELSSNQNKNESTNAVFSTSSLCPCSSSPVNSCSPSRSSSSSQARALSSVPASSRYDDSSSSRIPTRGGYFRCWFPSTSQSASCDSPSSSSSSETQEGERGSGAALASSFSSVSLWATVQLLREGRCMIVNSFSAFKFIACYSVLQFTSVLLLYAQTGNLTDSQYMWIDLVTVLPLSVTLARTRAADNLSPVTPPRSLVSAPVLVSLLGQIVIQVFFQVFALLLLKSQSFYVPYSSKSRGGGGGGSLAGYENTVVFLISSMQYVFSCAAFSSSSYPWRKDWSGGPPLAVPIGVVLKLICFGDLLAVHLFSGMDKPALFWRHGSHSSCLGAPAPLHSQSSTLYGWVQRPKLFISVASFAGVVVTRGVPYQTTTSSSLQWHHLHTLRSTGCSHFA